MADPRPRTWLESYVTLAARVLARPPRCGPVRLVAVDGPGGAGKSTFAGRLAEALTAAAETETVTIVHTDDFASWDDALDWWPRLENQVLEPLGGGVAGRFRRYDWVRREPAEWHDVPATGTVVLEGVSSARLAAAGRLTYAVWIETGRAVRLRRGLERDGRGALPLWQAWMAGEDRHYADDRTVRRADLVVDGDPPTAHDPAREYVVCAEPGQRPAAV